MPEFFPEKFPKDLERRPISPEQGLNILLQKELIKESEENEILKLPKQKAKKQIKKLLDKKTIH